MVGTSEVWVDAMRRAITVAASSPDPSSQVGAVALRGNELVGEGFNGFTVGACVDLNVVSRDEKLRWVEHAEQAALFNAARRGFTVSTLVCPWAACTECAKAIIGCGVDTLVRLDIDVEHRWWESIRFADRLLELAGVEVVTLPVDGLGDLPPILRNGELWTAI